MTARPARHDGLLRPLRRARGAAARRAGADRGGRRDRPQEGDDLQRPARARQPAGRARPRAPRSRARAASSIPDLTANVRRATPIEVVADGGLQSSPRASRRAASCTSSTTSTASCSSTASTPWRATCSGARTTVADAGADEVVWMRTRAGASMRAQAKRRSASRLISAEADEQRGEVQQRAGEAAGVVERGLAARRASA